MQRDYALFLDCFFDLCLALFLDSFVDLCLALFLDSFVDLCLKDVCFLHIIDIHMNKVDSISLLCGKIIQSYTFFFISFWNWLR